MRYLTTTEAAAVLHVDPSRVRLLCKLGRIKTIKIGNTYGIAESELERFAALQRPPGRPRKDAVAPVAAAMPSSMAFCPANRSHRNPPSLHPGVARGLLRPGRRRTGTSPACPTPGRWRSRPGRPRSPASRRASARRPRRTRPGSDGRAAARTAQSAATP